MARYRQAEYQRYVEADNGFGWTKKKASLESVDPNKWVLALFGVDYELEKRFRNIRDEAYDTGWYLYTVGVEGFFGEYCASTLMPAIDEASRLIAKADLRGEGYERKEST